MSEVGNDTRNDTRKDVGGDAVRAFAPASVGNLACGFDVLGLALAARGDVVTARPARTEGAAEAEAPAVTVTAVHGDGGRLPLDAASNTASVAALTLLELCGCERGVELEVEKGVALAGGLGSSAASAVAAVVAVDAALGLEAPRERLLAAAVRGEAASCGSSHADNVAPMLYPPCALVRAGAEPGSFHAVPLPLPDNLMVAILRPHRELSTRTAREVLPETVRRADAVRQWGNVGALVAALYREDWELLADALEDVVAEPVRAPLVPGFAAVRAAALAAGAAGASLSGAGPSIFALCRGQEAAERVADAMRRAYVAEEGMALEGDGCDAFVSAVDRRGARVL